MTAVILEDVACTLQVNDGLLHLTTNTGESQLLPLNDIEQLVIGQEVQLNGASIIALAKHGISLFALNAHDGACITGIDTPRNSLRIKQYSACTNEQHRLNLVKQLIAARMKGQNRVLKRLKQPLLLPPTDKDWQSNLMLLEAAISKVYWHRIAAAVPDSGFDGRHRRPPTDPINALISLVATMEDSCLAKHLLAEGFDITLGFHHATGYKRHSLLLDIKELTRYQQENWVLDLWLLGTLSKSHFYDSSQGCRLTAEGQAIFYPAWYRWQRHRRAHLRRLVKLCRRILEREISHGE